MSDLSFLSCFLSFFSLFFLSLSSFIFLLSFYALFLSSFLFFFLSFFLALLVFFFLSFLSWYTERAPTRTRVCWDSTHTGELLKKLTGKLLKMLLDVPLLRRYFCSFFFVAIRAAAPVRRCWLFVWFRFCVPFLFVRFPVLCVFPLCFCVRNASTVAPVSPRWYFLCQTLPPALPFPAFFCPLTPFFRLARLFYRLAHFSPIYRVIF